ncbi:MAG: hypothetical protein QXP55_00270 [Nitrososphaerales archaeon]
MGILNKIKSWLFKTPSLPTTPPVSETSPTPPLKVEIESPSSLNTSMVSKVSLQKMIEENKEQILKVIQEEKSIDNSVQPLIIQDKNMASQDISVKPEPIQTDFVQPLATQQEKILFQIVPINQNDSIQPSDIQSNSIQPIQHEDPFSQNVQSVHSETKIKKSRRTKSSCSKRSKNKLKESVNSGN